MSYLGRLFKWHTAKFDGMGPFSISNKFDPALNHAHPGTEQIILRGLSQNDNDILNTSHRRIHQILLNGMVILQFAVQYHNDLQILDCFPSILA